MTTKDHRRRPRRIITTKLRRPGRRSKRKFIPTKPQRPGGPEIRKDTTGLRFPNKTVIWKTMFPKAGPKD